MQHESDSDVELCIGDDFPSDPTPHRNPQQAPAGRRPHASASTAAAAAASAPPPPLLAMPLGSSAAPLLERHVANNLSVDPRAAATLFTRRTISDRLLPSAPSAANGGRRTNIGATAIGGFPPSAAQTAPHLSFSSRIASSGFLNRLRQEEAAATATERENDNKTQQQQQQRRGGATNTNRSGDLEGADEEVGGGGGGASKSRRISWGAAATDSKAPLQQRRTTAEAANGSQQRRMGGGKKEEAAGNGKSDKKGGGGVGAAQKETVPSSSSSVGSAITNTSPLQIRMAAPLAKAPAISKNAARVPAFIVSRRATFIAPPTDAAGSNKHGGLPRGNGKKRSRDADSAASTDSPARALLGAHSHFTALYAPPTAAARGTTRGRERGPQSAVHLDFSVEGFVGASREERAIHDDAF